MSAFAFGSALYSCMFCIGARAHLRTPLRVAATMGIIAIASGTTGWVLFRRSRTPAGEWIAPSR